MEESLLAGVGGDIGDDALDGVMSTSVSRTTRDWWGSGRRVCGSCLYSSDMRSSPGLPLYAVAHCRKSTLHLARTSTSAMSSLAKMRRRSRRGSSAKVRWKRDPAFWMRLSRMVRARSCLCGLPYLLYS